MIVMFMFVISLLLSTTECIEGDILGIIISDVRENCIENLRFPTLYKMTFSLLLDFLSPNPLVYSETS